MRAGRQGRGSCEPPRAPARLGHRSHARLPRPSRRGARAPRGLVRRAVRRDRARRRDLGPRRRRHEVPGRGDGGRPRDARTGGIPAQRRRHARVDGRRGGRRRRRRLPLFRRGAPRPAARLHRRGGGRRALSELSRLLGRLRAHRSPVRIPNGIQPVLDALGGTEDTPEERLATARSAHPALDRVLGALVGTVMRATMAEADGPSNAVSDRASATIECIVLPSTTREDLRAGLRAALGPGRYELEVVAPRGGRVSDPDTPLRDAIERFLAEHDPDARLLPALGYGFSDCDVMREAYGSVAYGFIPFRHADPMTNLDTKHGPDERIATADLVFQTRAAIEIARAIGVLRRPDGSPPA